MPNRIIRESSRTSPTLDALSDGAERMFWRLITVADDFGRFEADPRVLLAQCFPLKVDRLKITQIARWFEEMVAVGVVCPYVIHGRRYGFFPTWPKYQRIRAAESRFPEPPESLPSPPDEASRTSDNIWQQMPADVVKCPRSRIRDSRIECEESEAEARIGGETRARETTAPADFPLTATCEAWAAANAPTLDLIDETARFLDHHRAKGTKFRDWEAAWRNWMRKALTLTPANGRSPPTRLTSSQNLHALAEAKRLHQREGLP